VRHEWIPQKPLRCQLRPIQIPPRYSRSPDVQLPGHPHWHRLPLSIQYVDPCVCDRTANRYRRGGLYTTTLHASPDRSFSRPILVEQINLRLNFPRFCDQAWQTRFTSEDYSMKLFVIVMKSNRMF